MNIPARSVTTWVIPLEGHHFDLEDLPRWLKGREVTVEKFRDGYALIVPASVIGSSYEPVLAFAENQLQLINGAGRLLNGSFRPVSVKDKVFGMDSAGVVMQTVLAMGTAEIRAKAGVVGVADSRQQVEGMAGPLLRAAFQIPRAHDALVIAGRRDVTWAELYLLFELVESEVGGEMFQRGWISEPDADLFTHTANSYSTLRTSGRHGKDRGQPPKVPMMYTTAASLVQGLVRSWLNSVGAPGAS